MTILTKSKQNSRKAQNIFPPSAESKTIATAHALCMQPLAQATQLSDLTYLHIAVIIDYFNFTI